jgi:hypothetical protein
LARNNIIVEAYQQLASQHARAVDDLAAQASRCRSLKKELEATQTDVLAQNAVIEGYAQRLATQPVLHCTPRAAYQSLPRRIAELGEELCSMKRELLSASDVSALSGAKWNPGNLEVSGRAGHGEERDRFT